MLRGEVLTALASFGHDLTLNEACRRFHVFLDDRNTPLLPPDIRKVGECTESLVLVNTYSKHEIIFLRNHALQAVYVGVMQRVSASNRSDYESLLRLYRESDLSQEKTRILGN